MCHFAELNLTMPVLCYFFIMCPFNIMCPGLDDKLDDHPIKKGIWWHFITLKKNLYSMQTTLMSQLNVHVVPVKSYVSV